MSFIRSLARMSEVLSKESIHSRVAQRLGASLVQVEGDLESSCGAAKLGLYIVSEAFEGKKRIDRHRMVNELFDDELKSNQIHALSINAKTPAEHAK